jgi:hypothetical protein
VLENGENEKLSPEPKMKDASTSMSQERLSLMIKYNQIGSLSSLSRGSKVSNCLYNVVFIDLSTLKVRT